MPASIPQSASPELTSLAARICAPGPFVVPGLVALFVAGDGRAECLVSGVDAAGVPLRADTLFPLGSNGKLPLGLLILRLVDRGLLALDDPIQRYVPGAAQDNATVTIRRLLTHTSGLPIDVPSSVFAYGPGTTRDALLRACTMTPLAYAPGSIVQYSGVGYGLLALVIERITGEPLWAVIKREVLAPLGVDAVPANEMTGSRAATVADIRSRYTETPWEPVNGAAWRDLALPWAGLFGTAAALLQLTRAYAGAGSLVSPALLDEARTDQNTGLAGGFNTSDPRLGYIDSRPIVWPDCAWGLCIEVRGAKAPHWTPPTASRDSFGHLGSTGCLTWYDPAAAAGWAICGPRTTDNGWLLRYGPALGQHALRTVAPGTPTPARVT